MQQYLTLVILIIFIGAFIVKGGELILALLGVAKYFAVPLIIGAVIYLVTSAF